MTRGGRLDDWRKTVQRFCFVPGLTHYGGLFLSTFTSN